MVRRASDLSGRKDRRDSPPSHENFRGSGRRADLATMQAPSCGVLPNMLRHQRAGRLSSGRLFIGEQISGTEPPHGIVNFPYRKFALLWL
jgi:hypothetical protein